MWFLKAGSAFGLL